MRQNIFTGKHITSKLFAFSLLLFAFGLNSCKKADRFYEQESKYPQVNNTSPYAYKPAYVVGDTMVIIGRLQPENNLNISIGGVTADIVATGKGTDGGKQDKVSILITSGMVGKAREVKITSAGYSALGAAIDVYTAGGEGSFTGSLKSVQLATLSGSYRFLYGVTGKGDIYYYAPNTKDLRRIKKDGTTEILYDLSRLDLTAFLAGGVDPQAQNLYFSVQLTAGYTLYKLNLQTQALTVLNQSAELSTPYEGPANAVHLIVTGIYPDAKGNLYLGVGLGNQQAAPNFVPDAIARYNAGDGSIHYIYKEMNFDQSYTGMPGLNIPTGNILSVRFSPDEDLLYALGIFGIDGQVGIQVYNLSVQVLGQDMETSNKTGDISAYNVIAPFSGLQINLGTGMIADNAFGFLPMPHQRLQVLLFQSIDGSSILHQTGNVAAQLGFPKWTVFDFENKRTYAYAPGLFQTGEGQYAFRDTDELLNYDEEGNLYMTANGKSYLIQTQPVN